MEPPARPLVSVIIPTRNRRDRLALALDSVLGQEGLGTLCDLEIVVVDDASSDGTSEVVHHYPQVRYIRLGDHRGAAAARNAGLKATTGPYVAFLDDDDLWLPQKLSLQLPVLHRQAGLGFVYSQNVTRFEGQEQVWPHAGGAPSGFVFQALLFDCFCAHPPTVLVRRSAFDTAGTFDEQLSCHDDYDMWLRIAFHFPCQFVPGVVAIYHASRSGLWQTSMSRGVGGPAFRAVIQKALRMLPETPPYSAVRRAVRLRAELHIAHDTTWCCTHEDQWAATLAVLRAHPEVLQYRWGRQHVVGKARSVILGADAPMARGFAVAEHLRSLRGSPRNRWVWARLTMAAVWAAVAIELEQRAAADPRAAGPAAFRAILQNPLTLRQRALPRLVLRALREAPDSRR